jgi:protein PsiE
MKIKLPFTNQGLHWTTLTSEKLLLAIIGIATCIAAAQYLYQMYEAKEILLPDLFMLFIYVEIIGMVGAFYSTSRIPVTLPIIIAITALCRLIIMQGKEMDALMLIGEAVAVLILAIAAYIMSLKDKVSLEKKKEFSDEKDNHYN